MTLVIRHRVLFSIVLFAFQALSVQSLHGTQKEDIRAAVIELLSPAPAPGLFPVAPSGTDASDSPSITDVYRENNFYPLWIGGDRPTPDAFIILNILKSAENEGLDPMDYHVSQIESQLDTAGPASLAATDILLTTALHGYVSDIHEGRIDPCLKDPDLFTCARDRSIDPVQLMAKAMAASDLNGFLLDQAPDSSQYRDLRSALARYREIEANGGWPMVPEGPTLKSGMSDPGVLLIRERLAATGDLIESSPPEFPLVYDDKMVKAVLNFQEKQGLKIDGIIGRETRSAMNIPVSSLIHRIVINMERLRWLSRGAGRRHVTVNIASFELAVFNNGEIVLEMPVIVGKNYRETPVFSDVISYIEFNPFWNVPPSIARRDILPKLKKDPSYLSMMGIRVFDGWQAGASEIDPDSIRWETVSWSRMGALKLRQDPGPKNLLGRAKFMFPNRFSVYLHDTPSQELFQRTTRTFSSGCIRLSSPFELAEYLLSENNHGWSREEIKEIVDTGARTVVRLESPVPIHIVYLTAYTDANGSVHFKKDIYGRDAQLENALFGETERRPPSG
jgi:murein L,D-transpeptidase YcbB/YkuD